MQRALRPAAAAVVAAAAAACVPPPAAPAAPTTTTPAPAVTAPAPTTTSSTTTTTTVSGSDPFTITVRVNGTMTTNQQQAFATASSRWAQMIRGDLPDTSLSIPADDCTDGMAAFNGSIDDLLIDARIATIDGPGGILGQAGPCYIRISGGLPLYGIMEFDAADVASLEAGGRLGDTILHEMGHVLGLGTLWSSKATGLGTSDPRFVGTAAVGVWNGWGGAGTVPIENTGGAGTRDGHWRESTFDNELMTGWLDSGSNPLSALTVAALGDLGYTVDLAPADTYGLPGLLASMRSFSVAEHDHDPDLDLAAAEVLVSPRGAR